ncbi:MAG: hypothetical protein PVI89_15965 [Desulfobacteraceae bacterium]|jgi:hypothetical protein
MKNCQTKIVILKNALIIFLLIKLMIGHALGAARDENLPPGKNMNRVGWIQIPFADPFHLIVCSKGVRKELGITRKQLSQFRKMEPLFRSELRELSYQNDHKSRNTIQRHIDAARNGMGRILNPTQLKRLRQLLLQLHGPCSVVNDPKLASILKITDRQAKEINTILAALAAKSDQVYTLHKKENQQTAGTQTPHVGTKQKQMQQLLQSLNSKVYSLFSDEQKKIYKAAAGEPFGFKLEEDPVCLDDSR